MFVHHLDISNTPSRDACWRQAGPSSPVDQQWGLLFWPLKEPLQEVLYVPIVLRCAWGSAFCNTLMLTCERIVTNPACPSPMIPARMHTSTMVRKICVLKVNIQAYHWYVLVCVCVCSLTTVRSTGLGTGSRSHLHEAHRFHHKDKDSMSRG